MKIPKQRPQTRRDTTKEGVLLKALPLPVWSWRMAGQAMNSTACGDEFQGFDFGDFFCISFLASKDPMRDPYNLKPGFAEDWKMMFRFFESNTCNSFHVMYGSHNRLRLKNFGDLRLGRSPRLYVRRLGPRPGCEGCGSFGLKG